MKRYYNLKIENPEENGHIIEVNPESKLEDRIKILTSSKELTFLTYKLGKSFYEVSLDRYPKNNPFIIGFSVNENGDAEIYNNPSKIKTFFIEINENIAKKSVEDCNNWQSMQIWISEGREITLGGSLTAGDFL